MADKTPIRGAYNGASLTGLAEYATGDTIGVAFGGTGLAAVGANQLLTGNNSSTTGALTSESNLTFDGTILKSTGDLCATVKVVAPALCIGSEYVLPTADGSAGQIMCTDGSGALAFATASAGVTLAGSTNNTIATVTGSDALAGEANLTFTGTTLTVNIGASNDDNLILSADAGWNPKLTYTEAGAVKAGIEYDGGACKMRLMTGGTTNAIVIDCNQKVGIGTTAPDGKMHIFTAQSPATVNASNDELIIEGHTNIGMSFLTCTNGAARITWGDGSGTDAYSGQIAYYHDGDYMNFLTSSTERMRIDTSGRVGIGIYSNCGRDLSAHAGKLTVFFSNGDPAGYAAAQIMSLVNFNCTASAVTALSFIGTHCNGNTGDRGPAIAAEHVCNTAGGGQDHGNLAFHPDYNSSPAMRICTSMSVYMSTALCVNGPVSKASGSFTIEHPLESKKDTHKLVHSFIEGPQADLFYSGTTQLSDGTTTVNVDTEAGMTEGTFVALNRCVRVFTSNETNWDAVRGSITDNVLTIESNVADSTACVSWMVIGERHDKHMYDTGWTDDEGRVIVEPEISDDDLPPGETLESRRKAN